MRLKKLAVVAGGLLMLGGKAVLAEDYPRPFDRDEPAYSWEARHPMADHHREMDRFHSALDHFTEEELEGFREGRDERADGYSRRFVEGYGMMRPRRARAFRYGCGFRR